MPADGTPANVGGVHIDPTEWNRNDGFSPAAVPLTVVANLDPVASGLPTQGDIGASTEPGAVLALVDVDTGERLGAWAELDPTVTDPQRRLLRIVPAAALPEGHRIAVGLGPLLDEEGGLVERSTALDEVVADPTPRQQEWLDALDRSGLASDDLTVAWSFTVASRDGLSGRLRHMWEETAEQLDGGAPPIEVTSSEQDGAARLVRGTVAMPKFLTGDGGPGSVLDNGDDPDGLPRADGTVQADFLCIVPVAATGDDPAPFVLYGHGLLASREEVDGIGTLAAGVGIGTCATDWLGMSRADVATVNEGFADLSRFRTLPDRLQQGQIAFLALGRALAAPDGFGALPEFQDPSGRSVVDAGEISFLGASQGGILGGAASSLSPDWDRVVLAVGGLGYNLLLRRSIDFDIFEAPLAAAYPDALDRALAIELMGELWVRGENAGYAQHLTRDPLPGVEGQRTVLLLEAFGDHQVANVSTEKLARTLGVGRRAPTLADGRSADAVPFWGIPELPSLPHDGSALVVWDFGTPAPPSAHVPPREGEDPHGALAGEPGALALLSAFIRSDGAVVDVCDGAPCASGG